jgi:hypothetical protein
MIRFQGCPKLYYPTSHVTWEVVVLVTASGVTINVPESHLIWYWLNLLCVDKEYQWGAIRKHRSNHPSSRPEGRCGGSMFLCYVIYLQVHTALQPRKTTCRQIINFYETATPIKNNKSWLEILCFKRHINFRDRENVFSLCHLITSYNEHSLCLNLVRMKSTRSSSVLRRRLHLYLLASCYKNIGWVPFCLPFPSFLFIN